MEEKVKKHEIQVQANAIIINKEKKQKSNCKVILKIHLMMMKSCYLFNNNNNEKNEKKNKLIIGASIFKRN